MNQAATPRFQTVGKPTLHTSKQTAPETQNWHAYDQLHNKKRNIDVFTQRLIMKWQKSLLVTITLLGSAMTLSGERNNVITLNPPQSAPEWTLPAIQNSDGELSMSDFRGQITYVDFWASWCGPCRLSLPALNELKDQFKDRPVQFLAVSIDVVEEDAWDFLSRYSVDYPVVIDTDGDIARLFEVNGMPSGFLVDAKGMVREVHVGYKRGDELKLAESIKKMLSEMDAS